MTQVYTNLTKKTSSIVLHWPFHRRFGFELVAAGTITYRDDSILMEGWLHSVAALGRRKADRIKNGDLALWCASLCF